MQIETDPFPGSVISRPTSTAGELERIRYILDLIIGQTHWYQHPSISLETLNTSTPVIPSGTVMLFYQAAAPTGWTGVSVDDKFLRVVNPGGAGGTTGGAGGLTPSTTITLAHSHTVNSHTHDLSNHTHDLANHTHTGAAHTHLVTHNGWSTHSPAVIGELLATRTTFNATATDYAPTISDIASSSTTPGAGGTPSSNTSGTPSPNTSGAATPGTDSQLNNQHFNYANIIFASKD